MKKFEIYELKSSALNHLKGGAADIRPTKTVPHFTKETVRDKDSVLDDLPNSPKEVIG